MRHIFPFCLFMHYFRQGPVHSLASTVQGHTTCMSNSIRPQHDPHTHAHTCCWPGSHPVLDGGGCTCGCFQVYLSLHGRSQSLATSNGEGGHIPQHVAACTQHLSLHTTMEGVCPEILADFFNVFVLTENVNESHNAMEVTPQHNPAN